MNRLREPTKPLCYFKPMHFSFSKLSNNVFKTPALLSYYHSYILSEAKVSKVYYVI